MIRWLSRLLVAVALTLFAGFLFLVTPAGLEVSVKWLQRQLPGKLTYQAINGNIFGPINVAGLHYESNEFTLDAQSMHLEWRLPMLMFRHLDIANLRANRITITDKRQSTSHQPISLKPQKLSLPFALTIERARVHNLRYQAVTQHHDIQVKQASFHRFVLKRNKVRGEIEFNLLKPYRVSNYITLDGELSSYRFTWTLVKQHERLFVTGHGNRGSAYIFLNRNRLFGGALRGKIQFAWYPFLTWNIHLHINNLALSRFDPDLPNIQQATIHSVGIWEDTLPRFNCDALISSGNNRLSLIGAFNNAWNIRWNADFKDLKQLSPHNHGSLVSQGSIFGDKNSPLISAQLNARQFKTAHYQANQLRGDLVLDLAKQRPATLSLNGQGIRSPKFAAKEFTLEGHATQDFSQLQLKLGLSNQSTKHLVIATDLQGQLSGQTWQGQLRRLLIQSDEIGSWQTSQASAIKLAPATFELQETRLRAPLGDVAARISYQQGRWQVSSHGKLNNLNSIARVFSKYLSITSAANYALQVSGVDQQIKSVDGQFNAEAGRIQYTRNFENLVIPFKQMAIRTKSSQQDLITSLKATSTEQDQLALNLTFKELLTQLATPHEQSIDGDMQLRFSRLQILQFFIPDISEPSGVVAGQFKLAGTISNPSIQGKLSLLDGQVDIPSLKVQLDQVKLDLSAEKQKVHYRVTGRSADQLITADGSTDFSADDIESVIHLTGNNVLIVNTHEYILYANADLVLRMQGQVATLSGKIFIPRALIKPADLSTTVTLSDDLQVVRGNQPVEKSGWIWYYDLAITLGDDIVIDSFGLKGHLAGSAQLTNSPQQPNVIATGQLRLVDATYTTQGRTLTIEPNSYINYSHDPLLNPHLNLRMSRSVTVLLNSSMSPIGPTEATVGIDVKGTVKRPKITMFSRPMNLSQADIISYLLFNQAASGGSSANVGVILQAVQSVKFGGKSDTSTISQIQQSLGIAEMGVQEQTYIDAFGTPFGVNQSGFVLGKYITPRIYVRYTHGITTSIDIYQLRYIINKNWAIQAETGSQQIGNGLDLLYTVSRKHFPW